MAKQLQDAIAAINSAAGVELRAVVAAKAQEDAKAAGAPVIIPENLRTECAEAAKSASKVVSSRFDKKVGAAKLDAERKAAIFKDLVNGRGSGAKPK